MKFRTLASDPLLLKELASQTRRATRPGWTYPGPVWFLVATLVPAVVYVKLWWMGQDPSAHRLFGVGVLLHLWLVALRSALYTSTSLADDVCRGTIPVLLSTPLSPARLLLSKLVACTLPLWGEVAAAIPFSLAVYGGIGDVSASTVLGAALFLWATSVLFGGLGLWLGSFLADPERAAGTTRLCVAVLLLATAIQPRSGDEAAGLSSPQIVIAGFLLWLFLVWLPQVRPAHAVPGSIAALLLLLFLPIAKMLPELASIPDMAILSPIPALLAATQGGSVGSLLPVGAIYLAMGALLIHLTLCRARSHLALRSPRREP